MKEQNDNLPSAQSGCECTACVGLRKLHAYLHEEFSKGHYYKVNADATQGMRRGE